MRQLNNNLGTFAGISIRVPLFNGFQTKNNIKLSKINFTNSKTQTWRDNTGVQVAPVTIKDAKLEFTSTGTVKKVWVASPDIIGGASRSLNFAQSGTKVSFTLPELQYWDMVIVEY